MFSQNKKKLAVHLNSNHCRNESLFNTATDVKVTRLDCKQCILHLQVHQDFGGSLQHHSNGMHDTHGSGDMVNMVDPSSLSVHPDGGSVLDKDMNAHKP